MSDHGFPSDFGLDASDIGRRFRFAGDEWEIAGWQPRAPVFPLLARRVRDGKMYRLKAEAVYHLRRLA